MKKEKVRRVIVGTAILTLSCYGKISIQFGYNAGIVVGLQQKNGGWSTIKTWSNSSSSFAIVDKDWCVSKGYSYRLKLTHKGFNSS